LFVHDGARGLEHRPRDEVLRRDQLDAEAWRRASRRTQSAISGSACSSARSDPGARRQLVDLRDAARVASAFERRREPRGDERPRALGVEAVGRQREHVGVVVLARHARRLDVLHPRRAHAREAVGGVADTEPAAADHDPARHVAARDRARSRGGEVGIVDGVVAEAPTSDDLVTLRLEPLAQRGLELRAAVVAGDDDRVAHGGPRRNMGSRDCATAARTAPGRSVKRWELFAPEHQAGVGAAEAERIRERDTESARAPRSPRGRARSRRRPRRD
jgi:hypothetical protein